MHPSVENPYSLPVIAPVLRTSRMQSPITCGVISPKARAGTRNKLNDQAITLGIIGRLSNRPNSNTADQMTATNIVLNDANIRERFNVLGVP